MWLPDDAGRLAGELGLLFALALVVSAAGFRRVVYFVSLGYAFSIALLSVVTAVRFVDVLGLAAGLQCGLLLFYGLRLGFFLLLRERSPAYRRELAEVEARGKHIRGPLKVLIWVGVALLYALMFAPALFVALRRAESPELLWSLWLGLPLMAGGLLLEGWADQQKSAYKARAPERFCDVGLYAWVRCPNYLGELIFWLGAFVAGVSAYASLVHWLAAAAGFVCIALVMLGSTRRLELKQDERYGKDPDYQRYAASVPVLFPFVPVYSLKRLKVYLG